MITNDKIIEIFCATDEFSKKYEEEIENYCCPVNMCKGLQSLIFLLYKPPLKGNSRLSGKNLFDR